MKKNERDDLYKSTKKHIATVRAYADKAHMEKNEALFVSDICFDIYKVSSEEAEANFVRRVQEIMKNRFSDIYKEEGYSNVFVDIKMNSVQKTA